MSILAPSLPASAHLVSLGCPKNLVDSEVMLGHLRKLGVQEAPTPEQADVIIVNTCGFIESAKKESIDAILKMARFKQDGVCRGLVVSGCLSQLYRKDIVRELPEVDAFMGPDECGQIGSIVQDVWKRVGGSQGYPLLPEQPFQYVAQKGRPRYLYDHDTPRVSLTPKHYAYVKISEGCDNPCKFCIIPRLRGPFRSRPIDSIVSEVKKLADHGVVEINLIAQDLTDYGVDTGGRRLHTLLEKLNDVDGLRWIRLLYAYPAHVTADFIEAMALYPKVCKYLDLPIQHLNDTMLLSMGRRFGKQQTKDLIARMRSMVPGLALRTSMIVGMPGETEEIFQELVEEIREIRFERLGVFTYSKEDGTAAYHMRGHVREDVKRKRRAIVMGHQQRISQEINRRRVGQVLDILIDGPVVEKGALTIGRTSWDAPGIDNAVKIHSAKHHHAGEFVQVEVTKALAYDLEGTLATQDRIQSPEPAYST